MATITVVKTWQTETEIEVPDEMLNDPESLFYEASVVANQPVEGYWVETHLYNEEGDEIGDTYV